MKMVLVSVLYQGRLHSRFVLGKIGSDGRVRIDVSTKNRILQEIGCVSRGDTYSMG